MQKIYCYTVQPVDRIMADIVKDFGPSFSVYDATIFATLRGLQDELNGIKPENSVDYNKMYGIEVKRVGHVRQILFNEGREETYAKIKKELLLPLLKLNKNEMSKKIEKLRTLVSNQANIWEAVNNNYDRLSVFLERASQMAYYFNKAAEVFVKNYNKNNKRKIRIQDAINGITDSKGRVIKDFNSLMKDVYNMFLKDYNDLIHGNISLTGKSESLTAEDFEREFSKIFNPDIWGALVLVTKSYLKEIDGLNISLYNNVSEEALMKFTSDNDISALFSPEESTKEGWQIITDMLSPYSSLTKEVRKALSNVFLMYETKTGQIDYVRDSLGYRKRMDPFSAYKFIKEVIRNSCSREAMMDAISKEEKLSALYQTLKSDYYLQTQMFNNFNKIFQLYGQLDDSSSRIITLNKNNSETVMSRFLHALKSGRVSLFRRSAVEWNSNDKDNIAKALEAFNPELENSLWSLYGTSNHEKVRIALKRVQEALGLDSIFKDDSFIDACASSVSTFRKVCDILWGLYKYGGARNITSANIIEWILGKDNQGKEHTEPYNAIKRLADIVVKKTFNTQFQSQARSIDAKGNPVTLFADVQSNFMGDLLKKLKQFTDLRDLEIKSGKESDFSAKLEYIKNSRRAAAADYLINKFFKGTSFCGKYAKEMKFEVEAGKYVTLKNVPISDEISCAWLRYLWDDIVTGKMFDEDSFTQNFIFQRIVSGKFNGNLTAFENFTGAQHFKTIIDGYFAEDALRNGIISEFVGVPVFILGDSGVFKMLKVKRATSFSDYENIGGKLRFNTTKIVDELYKIYKGELRRMRLFQAIVKQEGWTKESKGNKHIFDNQNRFTMLTFLNEALSERSYQELCDMEVGEVKELISNYLSKGFNKFLKFGRDNGVLNNKNEAVENNLVQSSVLKIKEAVGTDEQPVRLVERLKEAYYNIYLASLNQFQMFTGDLGFYKDVKDFQKRYKEIHAPGDTLDTSVVSTWDALKLDEKGNPMPTFSAQQNAIWIKDMEANMEELDPAFMAVLLRTFKVKDTKTVEDAIKEGVLKPNEDPELEKQRVAKLKELLGNNYRIYNSYVNDTTRTDGQCYRSIDSYRKVQIMRGLWNDYMEALFREYKRIETDVFTNDRELTEDEMRTLLSFTTYIQPLKPFTYTFEEFHIDTTDDNGRVVKDIMNIPVQVKCAECVLLPALFKRGSRLRELGRTMQEKNIDLVGFDSALKVGAFGVTDLEARDASGNVSVRNNLMKGRIHKLDLADMKIQTNVPAHLNVQRGMGTQIRKLILNNLNLAKEYYDYVKDPVNRDKSIKSFMYTNGRKRDLNGLGIMNLYNGLIVANMLESFGGFEYLMSDPNKLSKLLSSSIINNKLNSFHKLRELAIDPDTGEFSVPLYEGASAHDNQGMLYSLYRQRVNKQDMQGGSLVQVTDYGINVAQEVGGTETERPLQWIKNEAGDNVIRAEIEIPFDFKYTDSFGQIQSLDYNEYCNPDGTFKKTASGEYKIDVDYPGMREIIAYRIPSEREYSMINCEVVRCVPPLSGGIIRVPAQGLTMAGFDFDIDKLYLLRKEFKKERRSIEKDYTDSELNDIFRKVYENDLLRRNSNYQDLLDEHANLRNDLKKAEKNKAGAKVIEDIKNKLNAVYKQLADRRPESSIMSILSNIRSTEKGSKPLNNYWDKMLELYPHMKDDPLYNKNLLFREAAEQLGLWKEPTEKEFLVHYNFNEAIDKNPRHARNNVIFDIIKGRLEDPETLPARLTPGGFANSKVTAKEMQVLLFNPDLANHISGGRLDLNYFINVVNNTNEDSSGDSTMDAADVTTLLYYNQLNQVAGKLIGIFANHNNNQQFTSTLETLSLKNPIIFGQMLNAKISRMSHNASSKNGRLGTTLLAKQIELKDGTIVDTDLTLAEFLAAAVDAVKSPVLNYLNFNQTTATPGVLLARMGHSLRDIGLLFNQPIIKDICDIISNGNNLFDFNAAKAQVFSQLASKNSRYSRGDLLKRYSEISTNITTEELLGAIAAWTSHDYQDTKKAEAGEVADSRSLLYEDTQFIENQLKALKIFELARNASQELNSLVKTTKFTAANAVGSTTGQFINLEEQTSQFINNKEGELVIHIAERLKQQDAFRVLNPNIEEDVVKKSYKYLRAIENNNLAFEQCMYDLNKRLLQVMEKYFPYFTDYYSTRREYLANFLHKESNLLSSDEIDMLHTDIQQQYLASIVGSYNMFDPFSECKVNPMYDNTSDTNYTNREYFLYKFPTLVSPIKDYIEMIFSRDKENIPALIDMIFPTYRETYYESIGKKYKKYGIHAISYNAQSKISLMEAWAEMVQMIPKFKDLLDSGIRDTESAIRKAASEETKEKLIKQKELLDGLKKSGRNLFEELSIGLFMHNYYQSGFNKTPFSYMEHVPYELKKILKVGDMPYLEAIKMDNIKRRSSMTNAQGINKAAMEMAYMYVLNHSNDYRLIKTFSSRHFKYITNPFLDKKTEVESFTIRVSDSKNKEGFAHLFSKSYTKSSDGNTEFFNFFPLVKYNNSIYACKIGGDFNSTTTNVDAEIEYVRVPTLGYTNVYNFYGAHLEDVLYALQPRWSENSAGERVLISPEEEVLQRVANEAREENVNMEDLMYVESENVADTANPETTVSTEENEMPDVDAMREKLIKCTEMNRNAVVKAMIEVMGSTSLSTVSRVLGMSETEGRQEAINTVINYIRNEIDSGNREVYSQMENLIICK